jgi:hypothetical protein
MVFASGLALLLFREEVKKMAILKGKNYSSK